MLTFWLSFLLQIPSFCYDFFLSFLSSCRFFADHGKVLKTINAASADDSSKVSSVVIEELDVLAKPEPIRNLKIVRTIQYGEFDVSLFLCHSEKIAFNSCQKVESRDRPLLNLSLLPPSLHTIRKVILSLFTSNVVMETKNFSSLARLRNFKLDFFLSSCSFTFLSQSHTMWTITFVTS